MAQKLKFSQIELPPHMADFPSVLPIFRAADTFRDKKSPENQWAEKGDYLKKHFELDGQLHDVGDCLVLKASRQNRVLQLYKASQSFLYYDRDLVSPTDPRFAKNLLSKDAAHARAQQLLQQQGLLDEHIAFEGFAYTGVSVVDPRRASENSVGKEYRTEIKACFGFKMDKMPVLGPGAQSMISFAGDQLSQWSYFWRRPEMKAVGEQKILPPEFVQKQIAMDPRFAQIGPSESKIRLNEIKLGYYAPPPFVEQQGYLPVYQLRGTLETRVRENGAGPLPFGKAKRLAGQDFLRYNFHYFVPATILNPMEHRASGFSQPMAGSMLF